VTRFLRLAAFLAVFPGTSFAGERAVPFWPDEVPAAIRAEIDGNAALETVREISRFHRVHGSPGYAAAAEHLVGKLRAAGLSDVEVLHFPADGKTRYAHFRSYLGWNPVSGTLEEISPTRRVVERFPDLPVALADYSQDADVEAALVDVGAGGAPRDYAGKDVRGKIVLADGPLPLVHRLACEEGGAAGFLSDFPNQTTAWSGDDRDLVRWGHLSPYQTANRFAFMLSKRQAEDYRRRLQGGEKIVLRATVRARMVPASYDVVSATIRGSGSDPREIVLTAHLCHESAGANDNASGSAAIFEVARALRSAIAKSTLPAPARTIRFLWLPEIAGSQAWLVSRPEIARRLVAGIHMDMVGGLLATTKGTFHVSRTAETLPHVVNVIARAWLEHVVQASASHAELEIG
jgi:aminopeptidase YwaD